jgi:DNA-binding LacI/PurR family transcriptional regulator
MRRISGRLVLIAVIGFLSSMEIPHERPGGKLKADPVCFCVENRTRRGPGGVVSLVSAGKRRKPGRPRSDRARFRTVAARLREMLLSGVWKPGEVLPSIRDLAERVAVGVNTVRQAVEVLKREGRVAVNARRRLVVRRSRGGRSLADGVVLVVVAGRLQGLLTGRYSPEVLKGIQLEIAASGAPFLVLHGTRYRDELPTDALDMPLSGIVLFGDFRKRALTEYERLGVTVVASDMSCDGRRLHSISINNTEAAREAASRALQLGHRGIAYLRLIKVGMGEVDLASRERETGVRAAVRDAGLPGSSVQVFNSVSGDTPESPVIQSVLEAGRDFTAVVATSAGRARLVVEAAEKAGLRVPGDLSVVCFQSVRASHPHISGMRTDFQEIGRRAVRLLSEPRTPAQHAIVPAVWGGGRTLGPPGGEVGSEDLAGA